MSEEEKPRELQFLDIARLQNREIQMVLREVEVKALAMALKGARQSGPRP